MLNIRQSQPETTHSDGLSQAHFLFRCEQQNMSISAKIETPPHDKFGAQIHYLFSTSLHVRLCTSLYLYSLPLLPALAAEITLSSVNHSESLPLPR